MKYTCGKCGQDCEQDCEQDVPLEQFDLSAGITFAQFIRICDACAWKAVEKIRKEKGEGCH